MDTLQKDFLEKLRVDEAYDFVANNAHLMRTDMLKRIVLECLYEIHRSDERTEMLNNIADELVDFWGEE